MNIYKKRIFYMKKLVLITMVLVSGIISIQTFAETVTKNNVEIYWGDNNIQIKNFNNKGVIVNFAIEYAKGTIDNNVRFAIEAGGSRSWTATSDIKVLRNIVVKFR
jgi:hypothetical protein